ncbi:hypothetical protein BSKO_11072 [Bryopsis sp. KO-2023]|nr:hypothetical protein BSKO_11072 [Bryopsis sp. KO-2023]
MTKVAAVILIALVVAATAAPEFHGEIVHSAPPWFFPIPWLGIFAGWKTFRKSTGRVRRRARTPLLRTLCVLNGAPRNVQGDGVDPAEQGAKSYPGAAIGMLKNWFVAQKTRLSVKYGDGNDRDPLTAPPGR